MDNWKATSQDIKEYESGDLVYLKRSLVEGPAELLVILWTLPTEQDEIEEIPKYLCRTPTHGKKVVFHCEVTPAGENGEKPSLNPSR